MENMDSVPLPVQPVPASVQLRSVGSLFSGSWIVYKKLLGTLIPLLLFLVLASILPLIPAYFLPNGVYTSVLILIFSILGPLLSIILAIALIDIIASEGTHTIGEAIALGRRLLWPYTWVVILYAFVLWGAFLLLIIPGFIMSLMLSMSMYVLIVENKRGLGALAQSWHYVKGHGWAVFFRAFVMGLVVMALIIVVSIAIGGNPYNKHVADKSILEFFRTVVSSLAVTLITPFSTIYMVLIYKDLRSLKGEISEDENKSRRKKLVWLGILGILALIIFVTLIVFGAIYLGTHKLHPAGTVNGIFRTIY